MDHVQVVLFFPISLGLLVSFSSFPFLYTIYFSYSNSIPTRGSSFINEHDFFEMQDNKWSPSQDPPHGYMALSNTNYPSYRDPAAVATAGAAGAPPQPQPQPPTIPQPPHTGEGSIHG